MRKDDPSYNWVTKDNPFYRWVKGGNDILDWPLPTGKKLRDSTLEECWELGRRLMNLALEGMKSSKAEQ